MGRIKVFLAVIFATFIGALISTLSLPLAVANSSPLMLQKISAQEGAGAFSLNVLLNAGTLVSESEYDYGYANKPKLEFDSVSLYDYVRVSPATKFSISAKKNGFLLIGDFKAETTYKVTLKSGLSSLDGKKLSVDATQELKTGTFRARFSFKTKARYLPQSLQGTLTWEAMNVDKIRFTVRQVFPQNLHQFLTGSHSTSSFISEKIKTIDMPIKVKKNILTTGTFSLSDIDTLGQGIFVIQANSPESDPLAEAPPDGGDEMDLSRTYGGMHFDSATVVVTNLTVVAKVGSNSAHVWVSATKDLSPIKNAQVELVASSNRKLGSCKTSGSNAECTLTWKQNEEAYPYAIIVRSGKDLTYVRFEDLNLPNESLHAGKRSFSSSPGGLDAYIYSERELYRPGETLHFAAQVRNSKFEAVPKLPIRWTITNPRGKVVREAVSDTSDLGVAQMNYPTSAASETGKYKVAAISGSTVLHETGLLVEEFVPERIGLKLTPEKEVVTSGTKAAFAVVANYLFGPPVTEGSFSAKCSMAPAFRTIPNRPDYFTGVYTKEPKAPFTLEAQSGRLNTKGEGNATCDWGGVLSGRMPEAYQLKARLEVQEAGSGRASLKTASAYVATTETLVGVKHEGNKGQTISIQGGLFDFNGDAKTAASTVKVQLLNVKENWYYTYSYGSNAWKVEEIIAPTGVEKTVQIANGKFTTSLDAPPNMWGRWIVRAVDTKTGYTADLPVGYLGWWYNDQAGGSKPVADPDQLKVELSTREASPGDDIEMMVTAPFAGRLLVSIETDTILDTKWIDVKKPGQVKTKLEIPDALPNVYITALLVKAPTEAGSTRFIPGRAWGASSLKVVPKAHRMIVSVNHPELTESRKQISLALSNDQRAQTEYSVAVVDEGILQMTDYHSPDPLKRFFEPRRLDVTTAETMGWTVAYVGNSKSPGGDEAGNKGSQNMPIKLVAFWFPSIKSDSSGRAEAKLTIPSFQGKVRIMAVASSKSRMGSTSTFMTVRDPLVLQPTLPRFMTQGDKFQFPVTVTNMSGKDQTVTVSVDPGSYVAVATLKKSLTIPNGAQRTATFDAEVNGVSGINRLTVKAESAGGKLNSSESFSLPVRPAGIEQTLRLAFDAKQSVPLTKELPGNWRPEFVRLEASVSNLPYLNQLSHLDSLLQYPYGCIEQTTSSTMPLLAIGELLQWVDSKKRNKTDIKDMVARGINRLLAMQTASGGFGYWPGEDASDPWGTAYVTHMLLDAKKLGYSVPQSALSNALSFLESYVRNTNYQLASVRSAAAAEPFALYVLAKGGRSITPELRETAKRAKPTAVGGYGKWDGLAAENVFLLAAAAKIVGDKETARILADEQIYSVQLAGAREQQHAYWSSLRSDGLRLSVLEDVWPQHPASEVLTQRVATALAQKGRYYSTQEMAWAVLALGKRIQGLKRLTPSALAKTTFIVNGKSIKKSFEVDGAPGFVHEGANLSQATVSLANTPNEKGIYMYLKATGYSKTPPTSSSPLTITRKYMRRDGVSADTNGVKQGDTLFVVLEVKNSSNISIPNAAIVDRVPAGFEIENPRLGQTEGLGWMRDSFQAEYQDMRDDRIQIFGDIPPSSTKYVYYSVRAVTQGRYTAPAAFVEAMYDPANFDYDQDASVQIVGAAAGK